MKISKEVQKAIIELIATSKASVDNGVFPDEASEEIIASIEVAEQFIFDCEVDPTDWEYIDKFGDALVGFGGENDNKTTK